MQPTTRRQDREAAGSQYLFCLKGGDLARKKGNQKDELDELDVCVIRRHWALGLDANDFSRQNRERMFDVTVPLP